MLQSISGAGVDAAWVNRDTPVHQLSLRFDCERLRITHQDPPWKVVRAFAVPNSGLLVHLHNVSGGILSGDRLMLEAEVLAGAAAQMTTTGATRIYRHRPGAADSEHHARFTVGDGALLEYLPDVVIPFGGSRHTQKTEFSLGYGSTLFWWEIMAPGRLAAGERFAFDRLQVNSEVSVLGRPVLREDYVLEPGKKHLTAMARMFEYSHSASLSILQQGRPPSFWRGLEQQLNDMAGRLSQPGQVLWGASMLMAEGIVVRGLCKSGCLINKMLTEFWQAARLAVTGSEAVPPRKIY